MDFKKTEKNNNNNTGIEIYIKWKYTFEKAKQNKISAANLK